MDGVEPYVARLAQVNRHGFGFLLAYGVTWTVVFTIVLAAHFVPYSWLYGTLRASSLLFLVTRLGCAQVSRQRSGASSSGGSRRARRGCLVVSQEGQHLAPDPLGVLHRQ